MITFDNPYGFKGEEVDHFSNATCGSNCLEVPKAWLIFLNAGRNQMNGRNLLALIHGGSSIEEPDPRG